MPKLRQWVIGLALLLGAAALAILLVRGWGHHAQTPPAPLQTDIARPTIEPLTATPDVEEKIRAQQQAERERAAAEEVARLNAIIAQRDAAARDADARAAHEEAVRLAAQKSNANPDAKNNTPTPAVTTVDTPANNDAPTPAPVAQNNAAPADPSKAEQPKPAPSTNPAPEDKKEDKQKPERQKPALEKRDADSQKDERQTPKHKSDTQKNSDAEREKSASTHTITHGDTLTKLSRRYGVPVTVIAEANGMGRDDNLPRGKTLIIPSSSQIKKLKDEADKRALDEAQKKRQEQDKKAAKQKLAEARKNAKKANDKKGQYGVQVSLAADKVAAERLAKKYQDAGYKVSTSQTDRGIRVIVGAESSQEVALALKSVLKNDSAVDAKGAWVLKLR